MSGFPLCLINPALICEVYQQLSLVWTSHERSEVVSCLAHVLVLTLSDSVSNVGPVLIHAVSRDDGATQLGGQVGSALLEVVLHWVVVAARDEVEHGRVFGPGLGLFAVGLRGVRVHGLDQVVGLEVQDRCVAALRSIVGVSDNSLTICGRAELSLARSVGVAHLNIYEEFK